MLGGFYMQTQDTNRAGELFDRALASPHIGFNDVATLAPILFSNF